MLRADFHYELPPELIAQEPLPQRSASRMLVLGEGGPADAGIGDFPDQLRPDDLLVFNDTRVIPARLQGHKDSGGQVEVMVERLCGERELLAQLRASKTPGPGRKLHIADWTLEVIAREDGFFRLRCESGDCATLLERHGQIPLPPYINREAAPRDRDRYQTVYAARPGAVAAPTAGLHFDEALLARIDAVGVRRCTVTLHVGAGTFQPVRSARLEDHRMHAEYCEVSPAVVAEVQATRLAGGRVIAIGTTAVRALESAAAGGDIAPFCGETRLFITPGYSFRVVDALLTNFHLPESTLLMLVSALAGRERVLSAYRHAVQQHYRFFSYGDAMWIP